MIPWNLPGAAVAPLGHALQHSRGAYGLSWPGAALRVAGIGRTALIAGA